MSPPAALCWTAASPEVSVASFEERFYRSNPTRAEALRRDIALALALARALWHWLVPGWRLRRAVARARKRGEKLLLEELPP
jgi:hypothetical protein